jgi:hypothetical protein
MMWLSHAYFVASRGPGSDISLFPTKEFLREILASTGTTEWLVSEGSDLPVWLIAPD